MRAAKYFDEKDTNSVLDPFSAYMHEPFNKFRACLYLEYHLNSRLATGLLFIEFVLNIALILRQAQHERGKFRTSANNVFIFKFFLFSNSR